jgi:hypothetical protein
MLMMSLGNTGMMIPILMESISAVIKMKSMAGFLPTEDVDMGAKDTSTGA